VEADADGFHVGVDIGTHEVPAASSVNPLGHIWHWLEDALKI